MAHWLVLMNQGAYDKALESLESFLTCDSPAGAMLLGLRAKVWIQVTKKTYGEALRTADRLAQAVTAAPMDKSANVPAHHAEAIEFLGHMVGFFEGPAEKSVDDNTLQKFEASVLARFDEPRKKIYQDAKTEVATEFSIYLEKIATAKSDSLASAAAKKDDKLKELSAAEEELSKAAGKLEDEQRQLREEFMRRMNFLDRETLALQQRNFGLQNDLVTANNTLSRYQDAARSLRRQVQGDKNKAGNPGLQGSLRQAENNVDAAQRTVNNIEFQIQQVQNQFNGNQQNKALLVREAQTKGFQLENEKQELGQDQKKIATKTKKVAKAKPGASPKAISLDADAKAFRTYDTFPLEESRDRLLTAVR